MAKPVERLRAAELALLKQARAELPKRAWCHPDLTPAEKQVLDAHYAVEREFEDALDAVHGSDGGALDGLADVVWVANELTLLAAGVGMCGRRKRELGVLL